MCFVPDVFQCCTAERNLRDKYVELTHLSYDAMEAELYAKEVITGKEKKIISTLVGSKKMEYLLDIIILSLKGNIHSKLKGFLEAMEENDDVLLKNAARKLGMWVDYVV